VAYELDKSDAVNIYSESELREFSMNMLLGLGATQEEAEIVTNGLMTASLWWHPGQGQGLEKFFRYHRRVNNGGIIPGVEMTWEKDAPAFGLLNGNKGFGYVAAHRGMARAIEKANTSGIASVGIRNSNHFGIAGYHAAHAAEHGLIGWVITNAKAEMAPWGSAEPVLGTNPWGISIPRRGTHPILLDIALTMSGKGMMRWYELVGKPMPESWALTPDGRTTTNPTEAMDGPLLPIGEYKGYGLSLISDVLAGVMTGSLFGRSVFQDDQNYDVGHFMLAINPEMFMSRDEFDERLEQLVDEVKSAPPIDPERPVMVPGEIEYRRMEQRKREGIPVSSETVEKLRVISEDVGVSCPL
jgi:LDH2 family malate/lactate/ureidoglycolate dehydrogenase